MNCGTCRYWDSSEADLEGEDSNKRDGTSPLMAYGPCTRIQMYSSEGDAAADYMPAYVNAASSTKQLDGLVTHINFYCALYSSTEVQEDEAYFWSRLFNETGGPDKEPRRPPRDIILEPGFPLTRARAGELLEWWDGKGWYTYGVSLELGWLTQEGGAVGPDLTVANEGGKP